MADVGEVGTPARWRQNWGVGARGVCWCCSTWSTMVHGRRSAPAGLLADDGRRQRRGPRTQAVAGRIGQLGGGEVGVGKEAAKWRRRSCDAVQKREARGRRGRRGVRAAEGGGGDARWNEGKGISRRWLLWRHEVEERERDREKRSA
ncbi:hypothetical protein CFC21_052193 [Triticum aestivum]|uniref:Uncharacterized protein n=3 Tax=Triticum TaxID=4564 RepID=A0A9R0VX50_TRITD|nr:hypothetical protein CFC21_052193 [Triticum aestivum]VAH90812.1 unnamed protein product [Triticum turgidum subsp. durum]